MTLSDIKQYVIANRRVNLDDLALHFDADPSAVEGMMDVWVRKGRVSRSDIKPLCTGGCSACTQCGSRFVIYEWVRPD
ncbi:FeoC-like transcriptional regulator [Desulfatiferula olefinivorans]